MKTIAEINRAIHDGETSPMVLIEDFLDHVDRRDLERHGSAGRRDLAKEALTAAQAGSRRFRLLSPAAGSQACASVAKSAKSAPAIGCSSLHVMPIGRSPFADSNRAGPRNAYGASGSVRTNR